MSPRSSKAVGPKAKPKADVYVGLLLVSIASLITGIVFLVLELGKYGWRLPQ